MRSLCDHLNVIGHASVPCIKNGRTYSENAKCEKWFIRRTRSSVFSTTTPEDWERLQSPRYSSKRSWNVQELASRSSWRCTSRLVRSDARQPGSGRPSKITAEIRQIVVEQMRLDDETTVYQLHRLLTEKGYSISLPTILRCRTALGWTFRGSAYCQLIREANKVKRLAWAQEHLDDSFDSVIWTDECGVQMESHRRFACRKRGEAPRPKPRYLYILCTVSLAFVLN